jgi:beta-galactosidase/beta-glucuronidase
VAGYRQRPKTVVRPLRASEKELKLNDIPRSEYPRPQLRRPDWTNLNGEWAFAFDDEDEGLSDLWYYMTAEELNGDSPFDRRIVVPFCYQARLSGIGETDFHDVVWYARTFETPEIDEDGRLLLHFGAVDYRAKVWVNGDQVAEHEGGHTPFSADVTDALDEDEHNVLVVRAEDPSKDRTIPRGKQYWKEESEGIFYTRTTGIWQTVWLEPVGRRRVDSLRLTPDVDSASVRVEAEVEGFEPGLSARTTVELDGEQVLREQHELGEGFDLSLALGEDISLWSPESPVLYEAQVELLGGEGQVLDSVRSYFGMRKVETRDGEFYLNGSPYYQRLILDQGYFPEGILTAPTDDDLKRDIELAKEMGFNGARKHQKVEDPRWHYWADVLGFLVWGEMANAYSYSTEYVRRITAEWQAAIRRDYNHPSVVAWVPLNESWGVPDLMEDPAQVEHLLSLYHLTRSLDRTRPVISNDGWEHALSDILALHNYGDADALANSYATAESAVEAGAGKRAAYCPGYGYRSEPILITEFGGIAFAGEESGWGYSTVADVEEFLARYGSLIEALEGCEAVKGFCYTQLTDVEQEVNGLLTYDRRPKADLSRIREVTAGGNF